MNKAPIGDGQAYATAMKRYGEDRRLIVQQGAQSHLRAKGIALSEAEYRRRVVDAFTVGIT
jgi:hypothetical protein